MATKKKAVKKVTKKKPVPKVPSFPEVLYVRRDDNDWGGECLLESERIGGLFNDDEDKLIVAEYHLAAVGEAVRTVGISFNGGE